MEKIRFNTEIQDEISQNFYKHVVKPSVQAQCSKPLVPIDVYLTDELQQRLSKDIPHANFKFLQKYSSAHPYAAALDQYGAYKIARARGKHATAKVPMIEIGTNVSTLIRNHNPWVHNCLKIDNARDQSRLIHKLQGEQFKIVENPTAQVYKNVITNAAMNLLDNPLVCFNGAECCSHKAKVAYSNQVYDLTPPLLFSTFNNHCLEEYNLYLNLPYEMLSFKEYVNTEEGYWFEFEPSNNKNLSGATFKMGYLDAKGQHEPSHIYKHDGDLIMYFTDQILRGADFGYGFDLQIEIVGNYGLLKYFRISRVELNADVEYFIPSAFSGNVMIPKIEALIKNNYKVNMFKVIKVGKLEFYDLNSYNLFNKDKFEKVMSYARTRASDALSIESIETYVRSLRTSILVGHSPVQERWYISDEQVKELVCFVHIRAVADKMGMRHKVGTGIKRISSETKDRDGLEELFYRFKEWARENKFLSKFMSHDKILQGSLFSLDINPPPPRRFKFSTRENRVFNGRVDFNYQSNPFYKFSVDNAVSINEAKAIIGESEKLAPVKSEPFVVLRTDFRAFKEKLVNKQRFYENNELPLLNLNKLTVGLIPDVDFTMDVHRIKVLNGPPGTGKTFSTLNNIKAGERVLFISQTAEQCSAVKARVDLNVEVKTFQMALRHLHEQFDYIIVDEAFMQPLVYYAMLQYHNKAPLILLGDPKQIGYINFDNIIFDEEQNLKHLLPHVEQVLLKVTHRCPQDVTAILNDRFGYKLHSVSKVVNSIRCFNRNEFKPNPRLQHLCLSQATKQYLISLGLTANTAHEVQGTTFSHVVVVLNDNDQALLKSEAHCIVLISRHTTLCDVYAGSAGKLVFEPSDAVENHLENFAKINIVDGAIYNSEHKLVTADHVLESKVEILNRHVDACMVEEVLDKVIPVCDREGVIPVINAIKQMNPEGKMCINLDQLDRHVVEHKGRTLGKKNYGITTFSANKMSLAYTYSARYAKNYIDVKIDKNARLLARRIVNHFKGKCFQRVPKVDQEKFSIHAYETFKAMKEKGTLENVNEDWTPETFVVNCFLKQQNKCKNEPHFACKLKAGQGVSDVNKNINVISNIWFRALMECLKLDLKQNIIVANGQDDSEYSTMIANILGSHQLDWQNLVKCESDISEQDTGYNNFVLYLELLFMKDIGFDKEFINFYRKTREQYLIRAPGLFTMLCRDRQTSGQAGTLCANTLNNLILTSFVIDDKDPVLKCYKGDDCAMVARSITINKANLQLLSNLTQQKIKFKIVEGFPSFIGYYVTPIGFVPDLVRIAAKVISKIIADEKLFYEYRLSVTQLIKNGYGSMLRRTVTENVNSRMNEISLEDASLLFDYLLGFEKMNYVEFLRTSNGGIVEKYFDLDVNSYYNFDLLIENNQTVKLDNSDFGTSIYICKNGRWCEKTNGRIEENRITQTLSSFGDGIIPGLGVAVINSLL